MGKRHWTQNFRWKASRVKTILRPQCSTGKDLNLLKTSVNSTLHHCAASLNGSMSMLMMQFYLIFRCASMHVRQ